MRTYQANGYVLEHATRSGLADVCVEAWEVSGVSPDLIAFGRTDSTGAFQLSLTEEDIALLFEGRPPLVYFRVLSDEAILMSSEGKQTWAILAGPPTFTLLVESDSPIGTERDVAPFLVRGQLDDAKSGPISGKTVKAFAQFVRAAEQQVGESVVTDTLGNYAITYDGAGGMSPVRTLVDLVVRAYEGSAVIAETSRCHAPPTCRLNLVANGTEYRGVSEVDCVSARLVAALPSVDLGTLTDDEVERIACTTQLDLTLVRAFRDAVKLETDTAIAESATAFYALIREGLPSDRFKLLTIPPRQLRRALEAARDANIIPPIPSTTLDDIMDALRGAAVDLAFVTPAAGTTANFGHVLALTLSSGTDQQTFVDSWTSHEGPVETFWDSITAPTGPFSTTTVARLQLSMHWGSLTRHHKPLLAELEARRAAATATTLRDLAKYSEGDWSTILDQIDPTTGQPIGSPADVPGANPTDKQANYAKILKETMETALPTGALHDRVFRTEGNTTDLWKFLEHNHGFEFGRTRVAQFMRGSPDLTGVSNVEALTTRLQKLERIFKVTPRYEDMKILLDDGIDSARKIERMGKTRFLATYAESLGNCRANAAFDRACHITAAVTHLLGKHARGLHKNTFKVLPDKIKPFVSSAPEVADWEELFGSLDLCACERCRSVHGPAAYLVDLLQFLDKQPSTTVGVTAKEKLLVIRPDIAKIELTCDNTNIALPQVDLNIELMERAIAATSPPTVIKSTGTTPDLLALPEVIDPAARDAAATALASAAYPWILPLDLPREEARVYLDHLGVPRWRLMEILQSTSPFAGAPSPTADQIAIEHLGMCVGEYDRIRGATGTPQQNWGYSSSGWETALQKVDEFLERSELTYEQLLELVDSAFLDDLGAPALTPDEGSDGCDLSKLSITGVGSPPTSTTWGKVHQLLRLRRRLGWTVTEVDQAIAALATLETPTPPSPSNAIDALLVRELSDLVHLRGLVRTSLPELLAWWADIDTRTRPESQQHSPYAKLFLDRSVQTPPDVDAGFDPPPGSGLLADHKKPILAALRLSESDFQILTVSTEAARELRLPRPLANADFTLANLSNLYRIGSLARAVRLPIRDTLIARALTGNEPLLGVQPAVGGGVTTSPAEAKEFVERVAKLRGAGFRLPELHYLIRHVSLATEGVGPEDAVRAKRRDELEAGLDKIVAATELQSDPSGAAVKGLVLQLGPVLHPEATPGELFDVAEMLVELIRGRGDAIASLDPTQRRTALLEIIDDFLEPEDVASDVSDKIVGPVAVPPDPQTPTLQPESARFDFVQTRFLDYVRRRDADGLIKQKVSAWFKLDGPSVDALLAGLGVASSSRKIILDLRPPMIAPVTASSTALKSATATLAATVTLHESDLISTGVTTLLVTPRSITFATAGSTPFDAPPSVTITGTDANGSALVENVPLAQTAATVETTNAFRTITTIVYPAADGTGATIAIGTGVKRALPRDLALIRLTKAATIVTRLKLTSTEMAWLFSGNAPSAWLDLNALPVTLPVSVDTGADLGTARSLLRGLERLIDVVKLRGRIRGVASTFFDFFNYTVTATESEAQTELARVTGWRLEDIQGLDGLAARFHLQYPADYRSEIGLGRLADAFEAQKRLGAAPVATLVGWSGGTVGSTEASETRLVAKAKHAPAEWLEVARPLRDVLREKQRASLVAHLVHTQNLSSPDELLGKLLVDLQMTCCQLTSRIKHAIGSVQMFVQRCLLDLVTTVNLSPDAAKEWAWMKSFVVWEAARKVFLYPENWIEPELRDDKTPFFKELESKLLQQDITDESAEDAYAEYLAKLDEVARLDVVAMTRQSEPADADTGADAIDVLHVFGRTRGTPHRYFYRTWADSSRWTPWTKVDVEIPGDHLLAKTFDRRLYLYWPVFDEKSRDTGIKDTPPISLLTIEMAWAERRGDRWLAPRTTSGDPVVLTNPPGQRAEPVDRSTLMLGANGSSIVIGPRAEADGSPYVVYVVSDAFVDFLHFEPSGCAGELASVGGTPFTVVDPVGAPDNVADDYAFNQGVALEMNSTQLLATTPSAYRVATPREWTSGQYKTDALAVDCFFFEDANRSYFVHRETITTVTWLQGSKAKPKIPPLRNECGIASAWSAADSVWIKNESSEQLYVFDTFDHPYACRFVKELHRHGLDGLRRWSLFTPRLQLVKAPTVFDQYDATSSVAQDADHKPIDDVDFSLRGAYAIYNWELFFHVPFMIAVRLTKNQRFEEALKWFHAIFDPTDGSSDAPPQKFWKVRPFYENKSLASIQEEMLTLAENSQDKDALEQWVLMHPDDDKKLAALHTTDEINAWRENPFNPHLLARMRPVAYQKATVMRYIDNLIEWGDQLFRRDTIEAINEAAQLYILAQSILGDRPNMIPPRNVAPKTYEALEADLDAFSNALESLVPTAKPGSDVKKLRGLLTKCGEHQPAPMFTLYFCIPQNEKLLGYWDTVADRLFKIRNCMNIEGVVRELPLFEPPIDPALLVAAAAAGVDIGSVLNDLAGPPPLYRFQVLHAKAMEMCSAVAGMGASLLSALEKRDAEDLSGRRATQELDLLTLVREVKTQQITEAQHTLRGLEEQKKKTETERNFYRDIAFISSGEQQAQVLSQAAAAFGAVGQFYHAAAGIAHVIPEVSVGPTSANVETGGNHAGAAIEAFAGVYGFLASINRDAAGLVGTVAGYQRRWDDWKLKEALAEAELRQIAKQIAAAQVRFDIATKELDNHDRQIQNAREVEEFLRTKFTNQDLYVWMLEQMSATYFQSYQLAYDMAKRAEKAWQFERGEQSKSFLKFGYWDSLKKGLQSAEALQYDLRRMELEYLATNKRDYEITKHVSMAEHFPAELVALREQALEGAAVELSLTEQHFDLDYPGHFMRRIKTIGMTIAGVTGPYSGVSCKLTQLKSVIRRSTSSDGDYPLADDGDARALTNFAPIQSICTSGGQNDAGLFELNFRDDRFLPFEGAGAVGKYRIELYPKQNRFDLRTVSDIVLHIRYTAREGGEALAIAATDALDTPPSDPGTWDPRTAYRLFSAARDFPTEWEQFKTATSSPHLDLSLTADRLPFVPGDGDLEIRSFTLATVGPDSTVALTVKAGEPLATVGSVAATFAPGFTEEIVSPTPSQPVGAWRIDGMSPSDVATLDDLYVLVTVGRS